MLDHLIAGLIIAGGLFVLWLFTHGDDNHGKGRF